jgi:maleylacetoacetate isomerase
VRIALAAKGVRHTIVPVNLLAGAQRDETYEEVNKMQQVPALEVGDMRISQSLAILHWLETQYPEPSMIPSDPRKSAKMYEICEIINSGIHPLQNSIVLNSIEKLGGNKAAWALEVTTKGFRALEALLAETAGRFCIGDQLTWADACLLPQVSIARRRHIDLSPYPTIVRLEGELNALETIAPAKPDQQPDAVL